MKTSVQIEIVAKPEAVWKTVTDIDKSAENISGIESIEILERPSSGLLGLKWRETRTLFGKTATEVMWITDVEEHLHYSVRAESHGSVYLTDFSLKPENDAVFLMIEFRSEPQSFGAKTADAILGGMMRKATARALMKDLVDIKKAVEK